MPIADVTFFHVLLGTEDCVMLTPFGDEPVARIRKHQQPDLLKHLCHGLLDKTIQGRGDTK